MAHIFQSGGQGIGDLHIRRVPGIVAIGNGIGNLVPDGHRRAVLARATRNYFSGTDRIGGFRVLCVDVVFRVFPRNCSFVGNVRADILRHLNGYSDRADCTRSQTGHTPRDGARGVVVATTACAAYIRQPGGQDIGQCQVGGHARIVRVPDCIGNLITHHNQCAVCARTVVDIFYGTNLNGDLRVFRYHTAARLFPCKDCFIDDGVAADDALRHLDGHGDFIGRAIRQV